MRRMRHLKPREIQGCQLALDSSIAGSLYDATTGGSLVAADGAVARWEDQSGNGNHVIQGTGANQPLRRVSAKNGLDALEFDGTNDYLDKSGLNTPIPITTFAFASQNADTTGILVESTTKATLMLLGLGTDWVASSGSTSTTITNDSTWGGLIATYSSSGSTLQRGRSFSSAGGTAAANYTGVRVGAIRNLYSAFFWDGYITEVAIYNREVDRSVRQRLNDSRSRKWRTDR